MKINKLTEENTTMKNKIAKLEKALKEKKIEMNTNTFVKENEQEHEDSNDSTKYKNNSIT